MSCSLLHATGTNFPARALAADPRQRQELREGPSFSFAALMGAAGDTTTELYGWTRRVFLEFRELELRLLLAELKPALKFSA